MIKKTIALITVLCIASCSFKQKDTHDPKMLTHHILGLEDNEFIGFGGSFIISKTGLIGIEESSSFPIFYEIQMVDNKNIMSRFINRGQGPNDLLMPFNIQFLSEGTIGVYDIMNRSYYNVPYFQNNYSGVVNIEKCMSFNNRPYRVLKTAYDQYLALSADNGLFALFDSDGSMVNTFFEYPYKDRDEKNIANSTRALAYQGTLVANPGATKCVYAPFNGDIIQFYNIQKDSISLINKIVNIFPDYNIIDGRAAAKTETNRGYVSIATTENYIYALFNGNSIQELLSNEKETMDGQIVRIFDWSGNKINEIGLDIPCKHIGVSQDDRTLWAIGYNPEMILVTFNLNEDIIYNSGNKDKTSDNTSPANNASHDDDNELDTEETLDISEEKSFPQIIKIERANIYKSKTDTVFGAYKNLSKIISIKSTSENIKTKIDITDNYTVI